MTRDEILKAVQDGRLCIPDALALFDVLESRKLFYLATPGGRPAVPYDGNYHPDYGTLVYGSWEAARRAVDYQADQYEVRGLEVREVDNDLAAALRREASLTPRFAHEEPSPPGVNDE